jgi:hypothetical protein
VTARTKFGHFKGEATGTGRSDVVSMKIQAHKRTWIAAERQKNAHLPVVKSLQRSTDMGRKFSNKLFNQSSMGL